MIEYRVRYELEVRPTNVIVEIKCDDELDAQMIYENRANNCQCKNIQLITLDK